MRADAALSPCMLAIDSMDGTIKRRMFIRRQTSSFAILLRMHTRGRRFHISRLAVVVVQGGSDYKKRATLKFLRAPRAAQYNFSY